MDALYPERTAQEILESMCLALAYARKNNVEPDHIDVGVRVLLPDGEPWATGQFTN